MANIINSLTLNTNNTSKNAVEKFNSFKKNSQVITAPDSLPKYSIDKILSQQDEYRRGIKQLTNKQKNKDNFLPKIVSVVIAGTISLLLMRKK